MIDKLKRYLSDVVRVLLLLVVTGLLLWYRDEANAVIYDAALIGVFLVGTSHITRRVMMPKLDLQSIAHRAIDEQNWPAAIVFATIIYFLVQVMDLSMRVFK